LKKLESPFPSEASVISKSKLSKKLHAIWSKAGMHNSNLWETFVRNNYQVTKLVIFTHSKGVSLKLTTALNEILDFALKAYGGRMFCISGMKSLCRDLKIRKHLVPANLKSIDVDKIQESIN